MQTAQTVNDVIDHLATKLSVPVQHLWAVLTRQGQAEAYASFAWAAFLVVVAIAVVVVVWRFRAALDRDTADYNARYAAWEKSAAKNHDYWNHSRPDHEESKGWAIAVGAVVVIALTLLAFNNAVDGTKRITNPEYFALQQVLSAIK